MVVLLLLGALAVFAVWEFLLDLSPWPVPPVLQPLMVGGLGYLASILRPDILLPVAIVGAVALLHSAVRREPPAQMVRSVPVSGRRSERGSRIPRLP